MARNRKSRAGAGRFGPGLIAVVLCLIIGGSGVGYVWQKDQLAQLGKQIKARETSLARMEMQNEKLRNQLAVLRSQPFLEMQIKRLNLGLVPPQPAQIVRLPEPSAEPAKSPAQYAAQQHGPLNIP